MESQRKKTLSPNNLALLENMNHVEFLQAFPILSEAVCDLLISLIFR